MTNQEAKELQRSARDHARRLGHSHIADDFAQDAIVQALADGAPDLASMFREYLRRERGDSGIFSGAVGQFDRHRKLSFDAPLNEEEDCGTLYDVLADVREPRSDDDDDRPDGTDLDAVLADASLGWRDDLILTLRRDGAIQREIGNVIGRSQSSVADRLKAINGNLEQLAVLREVMPAYRNDSEYSKLEVRWIAI